MISQVTANVSVYGPVLELIEILNLTLFYHLKLENTAYLYRYFLPLSEWQLTAFHVICDVTMALLMD
jgi:hypothetical protein